MSLIKGEIVDKDLVKGIKVISSLDKDGDVILALYLAYARHLSRK